MSFKIAVIIFYSDIDTCLTLWICGQLVVHISTVYIVITYLRYKDDLNGYKVDI